MAKIDFKDKKDLEKLFQMNGGYVLDFNDRAFKEFVYDAVEEDIDNEKYKVSGTSKANRLRTFWNLESDFKVGNLIHKLTFLAKDRKKYQNETTHELELPRQELIDRCSRIATTLKGGASVEYIDAVQATGSDRDFESIARSIRESIEKNEPESALDRLHTYVMKFVRGLCEKHNIAFKKEESLNAVFGKYVRYTKGNKMIESEMAEKILTYSIALIQAFNDVRNNRSFAHDNPVLNYDEAILIFNNIANMIKFINELENKIVERTDTDESSLGRKETKF